jgi:hypothetical protein
MALPGNLTTVEVTGRYIDASGAAVRGSVTFTLDTPLLNAGASTYIIETEYTVTLDATGSFAVDLPATNDVDVTPTGWTWTLTPNFDGADPLTFALPTNLGPTVDITVLAPALPNPSTTYSYVLTSAVGAPSGVAPLNSGGTIAASYIGAASITAAKINSEAATNGQALVADGTGGATFGNVSGGGGSLDPFLLMGA